MTSDTRSAIAELVHPCPFCGGRAEYKQGFKTGYVMCLKCEAMGPNLTKGEAVTAWNTRSQSAPTMGAYRWIDAAVKALQYQHKRPQDPGVWEEIDKLLSGVPCPQVDLGFDSPADRAARSSTRRSESGESFLGELDYREMLIEAQAALRSTNDPSELIERIDVLLDGKARKHAPNGPLAKRIENLFSFLYAEPEGSMCHFNKEALDEVKAAALRGCALSATEAKEKP